MGCGKGVRLLYTGAGRRSSVVVSRVGRRKGEEGRKKVKVSPSLAGSATPRSTRARNHKRKKKQTYSQSG